MRRFLLLVVAFAVCTVCAAQTGLKGKWKSDHSLMGVKVSHVMNFESEDKGAVSTEFNCGIDLKLLGSELKGSFRLTLKGTFRHEADRLVINWDPESLETETGEISGTVKGVPVKELEDEIAGMLSEVRESIPLEELGEPEEFAVTFKNSKMTLATNVDGDVDKETFVRVK